MPKVLPSEMLEQFVALSNVFADALSQAVTSLLNTEVQVHSEGRGPSAKSLLWMKMDVDPLPEAYVAFGGSAADLDRLARAVLAAAGEEEPDADLLQQTLCEIASQVIGAVLTVAAQRSGQHLEGAPAVALPDFKVEGATQSRYFQLAVSDGLKLPILLAMSNNLLTTPARAAENGRRPVFAASDVNRMDLLLDVEMPLKVSLGKAHMALKDVVRLTTGSIVELGKDISDPVDVIVNNRVIARGDVVVVDGNFGVKIREVLSREDRVRHCGV